MTDTVDPAAPPSGYSWHAVMLVFTALLGVIVMTALVLTMSEATRQRDRALAWQSHSFEVMLLTRTLTGTIARAEASLGRYVISADRQLGVIYTDDWRNANGQITRLESLTNDSDAQSAAIARLRDAFQERSGQLSDVALSTRYGKNDQALSRFYQARNAPSLKQLNGLLDEITLRERNLLVQRTDEARRLVDRSSDVARVLVIFGILIVVGAIALGGLTVAALAQRGIARTEADAERDRASALQAAVTAATAELERQAAERAAAEEKLRQGQKMEAVGQLTGGIAHDFNNMLAVVLGGLELAKRRMAATHPALRHIDNATDGAKRAVVLTRRLLAFSRAEALLPAAIEPDILISGMADLLDRTLGDAITVETAKDGGDWGGNWRIWVDRHQLENAMLNLAVNARDAMDGRGTLTITLGGKHLGAQEIGECAAGDYVSIAVGDTGCGMSPAVLQRVFEPFFTTKPVGKGTGLGLSQIFGFVRQSDGEIAIESHPGRGTVVTIYLPRYLGNAATELTDDGDSEPTPQRTEALRILVVEDDPRVLATTIAGLAALDHVPTSCGDPLAAPALVDAGNFDLIISDVLMPGQTGPEMIARIRPRHPALAVLFVTGFAGEASGAPEFGGHAVLRKPFTLATLDRAIADALLANRPAKQPVLAAE